MPVRRKNHRKILRDTIQGISKPALRRLARRGGVKRLSVLIYPVVRNSLKIFLTTILNDAFTYTMHAWRGTVMTIDVIHALKRNGRTLYGFDSNQKKFSKKKIKMKLKILFIIIF